MEQQPTPVPRGRSLLVVLLAYLVAAGAAAGVGALVSPAHPLWVVGAADLAGTLAVFAFSVALDNSSLYDPYWSVAPAPIGAYLGRGWLAAPGSHLRPPVVWALVLAWGARLTFSWARGWPGLHHEDWRYREIRHRSGRLYWPASLLSIHLLPTAFVYLGCLSLWPALSPEGAALGPLDAAGLLVTGCAIWLEATADRQLHDFVRARTDPGQLLNSGLWARVRHPNYLGELMLWWGLYLFSLAADPGRWWTGAGPLAMTALFVFISVPLIDRRMLRRKPGYAEHMRRVPALLPWPWRR